MTEKTESTPKHEGTHAPWQREFFQNVEGFVKYGIPEEKAKEILMKFLKLSSMTPMPAVMESFRSEEALERVGVHTVRNAELSSFMLEFLEPLMTNFTVEGKENLAYILPLIGKYPMTLISNHLSHLDAPAIYQLLYRDGGDSRKIAEQLIFIAGRLAFEPDFTRLALYMFDTLLVCSKLDMADNPGMADLMTRINMRSFRTANQMQKQGRIVTIFPEGTRSRTGKLIGFVDTVYHYVANKVIIPVSLSGTEEILPTSTFLFKAANGKLTIGRPVLIGELTKSQMETLPDFVQRVDIPADGDKKQFVIDTLATLVGQNLHRHRHGTYRNLYLADQSDTANILIRRPDKPVERVVIIGHSPYGTAAASILANKKLNVEIFIDDAEKAEKFNEKSIDLDHFPLFKLPPNIRFTADPSVATNGTLFVQAARPWEFERYHKPVREYVSKSTGPVVNIVKGFIGTESGLILDELTRNYGVDPLRLAVLAGANYPDQIMERKICGFEVAANSPELVSHLAMLFSTGYVFTRPAVNPADVKGVQLGGALKNIYAMGVGLLDGYYEKNLGGNSDSSLFHVSNRIFHEMTAIGTALGGHPTTFSGLSGLTDLMLSCFGQDARDRHYGHDVVYGKADPEHKSPGLFGIRFLPNMMKLDPEKYPVATAIHAVIVQKVEMERIMNDLIYRLRRF